MFKHDTVSRSKVICKLTGLLINKSEEHLWKHINGKRFLNALDKLEAGEGIPNGAESKQDGEKVKGKSENGSSKKKKNKKKEEKQVDEIISEVRDSAEKSSDTESEADFWMPPVGERWDHDDGDNRWGSGSESAPESDEAAEENMGTEEIKHEAGELSKKTKRISLEIEEEKKEDWHLRTSNTASK